DRQGRSVGPRSRRPGHRRGHRARCLAGARHRAGRGRAVAAGDAGAPGPPLQFAAPVRPPVPDRRRFGDALDRRAGGCPGWAVARHRRPGGPDGAGDVRRTVRRLPHGRRLPGPQRAGAAGHGVADLARPGGGLGTAGGGTGRPVRFGRRLRRRHRRRGNRSLHRHPVRLSHDPAWPPGRGGDGSRYPRRGAHDRNRHDPRLRTGRPRPNAQRPRHGIHHRRPRDRRLPAPDSLPLRLAEHHHPAPGPARLYPLRRPDRRRRPQLSRPRRPAAPGVPRFPDPRRQDVHGAGALDDALPGPHPGGGDPGDQPARGRVAAVHGSAVAGAV
ncbi:MAG: Oligopeptide transport system permease protein OppC, partial [uncultured Thermomicrobiales bacterium]